LLDVVGLAHPEGIDGRSFAPLLQGESQREREMVVKEYNENAGGSRDPMRAVQTKRLLYLFNPWSNGDRVMATATPGTPTYRRMAELAKTDSVLAARHDLYQHRVVEELYDVRDDPDCLVNLIDDPAHQPELAKLREALEAWMVETGDHMLDVFRNRGDPAVREAYVLEKEREADERRKQKRKPKRQRSGARSKKRSDLIAVELPDSVAAGKPLLVKLCHKVEADLGEQLVHVTLKAGPEPRRVERKVAKVSGEGVVEVTFDVPDTVPGNVVCIAAFIGEDYASHLQHLQTDPVPVR
ncbi:MAG: heparan N-sulfatase, partial [Planctomycetes bacterium]|nr:heparan N-sulfatase [Planctomycetota bacterium]